MTLRVSTDEIVETDTSGVLGVHPSWARVRLREVATVQNGFAFKSGSFSKDRGLPLLRIRDVGANDPDTFIDDNVDPAYVVERGDIVVGMDGDFRAARWDGPPSALNQRVCRVIPTSPNFDSRFLFHTLQPYLDAVNRATSAITVKHLSSATVSDLPVPLPPLAEQERIVATIEEAFSKLDAGEAGLRTVRQLLKRMRDAVLAAAVTGHLVPQDPTDTPATKLLADVGAAAGVSESALPPGWAACPLGAVTVCQEYGLSLKAHAERAEGDVPILRMGNVRAGRVDARALKFVGRGDEGVESRMLRDGDLLFNRTNSKELVGKSSVYRSSPEDATFASYLIRVRTADGVEPEWCASVINSHLGRAYVEEVAVQQVGQANVNGTKLKQFPLLLPPREEQVRILAELARQVSFLDACEGAVEGGLARSAALRRSVLKAAFEGKLVRQDPSDEPASVLLERIRVERAAAPKADRRSRRTA